MDLFGNLSLIGPTDRSIVLQTRRGNGVKNAIDPPPRHDQIQRYQRMIQKHSGWLPRRPPVSGYNCVGHVWASRRTGVFDQDQIELIFQDDGFRTIDLAVEKPHVGDLIAYWTSGPPPKVFIHVGLVIELKQLIGSALSIPWVLSKLDATSGEVVHSAHDIEFGLEFEFEFWTERPLPK